MSEEQIRKINTMHALETSAIRFILFYYIRCKYGCSAGAHPHPRLLLLQNLHTLQLKLKYNV